MSAARVSHQVKPVTSPNVALFLSNVRLLNLDTLPDWPHVTATTFDAKDVSQNQKRRISAVEWLLYRLFQILDPLLTREKLQPFFPPLEPLQSINLRAALFRCFNELKKTGMLGREAVVRKTMLDECKGEKFEDLLLIFSALVLRKRVQAVSSSRMPPVAQRLATTDKVNSKTSATMIPLSLAHRASLQAKLNRREGSKASFRRLSHAMYEYQDKLLHAQQDIEASQHQYKDSLLPDDIEALKSAVQLNWAGRIQDAQLLFGGDSTVDEFQDMSYEDARAHFQETGLLPHHDEGESLLSNLDSALQAQNERLAQWRIYSKQMRPERQPQKDAVRMSTKTGLFNAHREICIGSSKRQGPDPSQGVQYKSRYDEIILNMKDELSKVTERRSRQRVAELNGELAAATRPLDSSHPLLGLSGATILGGTAGTPDLQAPSQRPQLDFFSPVKGFGTSAHTTFDSDPTSSASRLRNVSTVPDQPGPHSCNQRVPLEERHEGGQLPSVESLLGVGSDGTHDTSSTEEPPNSTHAAIKTAPRPSSLAERARRSIATGSLTIEARRRQEKKTRPSILYPVNQFETPVKATSRVATILEDVPDALAEAETGVDVKDELLVEDDEYASVFKSRPKIALSPILSPLVDESMMSGFAGGLESVYEHQESPLGAMSGTGRVRT